MSTTDTAPVPRKAADFDPDILPGLPRPPFRGPGIRFYALAALAYAGLFVGMTAPASFRCGTQFLGVSGPVSAYAGGGDHFTQLWFFWHVRRSLRAGEPLFSTRMIYHPTGTPLWLHSGCPVKAAMSLPFQELVPWPLLHFGLMGFSFVAAGLTAAALAYALTSHPWGAFMAGLVYSFSPYHFAHAWGHHELVTSEGIPLFLLFLLRWMAAPRLRDAVAAGAALALVTWTTPYYLMFSGTAGLGIAGYVLAVRPRTLRAPGRTVQALAGLAVYVTLAGPYLAGALLASAADVYLPEHFSETWSADVFSFVVPGGVSTYAPFFRPIWSRFSGGHGVVDHQNYLGWTAVALAALALRRRPGCRPWGWWCAGFLVLSLGVQLRILGVLTPVPLPYRVLEKLVPPLKMAAVPERFTLMVLLGLAVLAAHGLAEWESSRAARGRGPGAARAVLLLLLLEYLPVPFPSHSLPVPAFYRDIAGRSDAGALLEVTDGYRSAGVMYYQMTHGLPITGGHLARVPERARAWTLGSPVLAALDAERPDAPPPAPEALQFLRRRRRQLMAPQEIQQMAVAPFAAIEHAAGIEEHRLQRLSATVSHGRWRRRRGAGPSRPCRSSGQAPRRCPAI